MPTSNIRVAGPARLLPLDVLRGLAILLVLGHHPVLLPEEAGSLQGIARLWSQMGWTGVDLFFVLSGFLIGGLLFQELAEHHDLDVRRFLIRRGWKIYPSYYVYLVVLAALLLTKVPMTLGVTGPLRGGWLSVGKALASNLLNIQNYLPTIRGHTWSLAVEEHFYLILPFVLLALPRRTRAESGRVESIPALPWLAGSLIVLCTVGRFLTGLRPGHNTFFEVMTPTHLRLDGLFLGVALAYFARFRPEGFARVGRHRWPLLAVGLTLIAPMAFFDRMTSPLVMPFGTTLLYLGYGAILVALVSTPVGEGILGRALGSRPSRLVAFVGVYSYPVYLWHIDLAQAPLLVLAKTPLALRLAPSARWAVGMALYLGLATMVGLLMSRIIERPSLALRDRLFPRRGAASSPAVAPKPRLFAGPRRRELDSTRISRAN